MTTPARESPVEPHAELFLHGADVGVRGIGPTCDAAFEQAALALTSVVTDPTRIASKEAVEVTCEAPDNAYLLSTSRRQSARCRRGSTSTATDHH
jgi:tRNA nucleotidyltransferase (CCA-adding enzyme)